MNDIRDIIHNGVSANRAADNLLTAFQSGGAGRPNLVALGC